MLSPRALPELVQLTLMGLGLGSSIWFVYRTAWLARGRRSLRRLDAEIDEGRERIRRKRAEEGAPERPSPLRFRIHDWQGATITFVFDTDGSDLADQIAALVRTAVDDPGVVKLDADFVDERSARAANAEFN